MPWRACGKQEPWVGSTHADKMAAALRRLEQAQPGGRLIWGGEWNQTLIGRDHAGAPEAGNPCWH